MRKATKIPLALIFALAVAIGAAVLIVVQINRIEPPPAVVAPIETPATKLDTDIYVQNIVLNLQEGDYAIYPTLAGFGRLRLSANTSGWYYYFDNYTFVTVVRRTTGDAMFNLGYQYFFVYIMEINDTHALVYYSPLTDVIVAKKIPVGVTGWIVYYPVPTDLDNATVNAIVKLINTVQQYQPGVRAVNVFQPKRDYITYDPQYQQIDVYVDRIVLQDDGTVQIMKKGTWWWVGPGFTAIEPGTDVISDGLRMIDQDNYVLYPTWALLYYYPVFNIKTALAIAPAK